MRWVLLILLLAAVGGLIIYLTYPEPEAEKVSAEKVSSETFDNYDDPIAVLEESLRRYDKEVTTGYRTMFHKQERIAGRLHNPEEILVYFREKPFSVYFQWLKGMGQAERALYVAGENDGQMLARPYGFWRRKIAGDVVSRDPEGADARKAGRYSLKDFGIKKGTERTLAAWKKARDKGILHVKYRGLFKVEDLDNRLCYSYVRACDPPEEDGLTELTIYIDKETWLQTGSVLRGKDGLIASYLFRDLKLNPRFKPDQFTRKALTP